MFSDKEALRADAASDLLYYTQLCDEKYTAARLHEFLGRELQKSLTGGTKRLLLNIAPQHGKSRLCTVEFPTWVLANDPTKKIAVASYGQDLANKASREARERLQTPEFQLLSDTRLDPIHSAVQDWGVIGGGGYKAVGVSGPLTGHSVDLLIIDDPIKNPKEAFSVRYRDDVWDWYQSVAYTRLSEKATVVVIQTRWHPDDLTGRLLKQARDGGEHWRHVNLKALAPENDLLGRRPGEALFPQRHSAERLKVIRDAIGHFYWTALYEGEPVERGGNYIDVGSLEVISPDQVPEGLRWMRFWDLATTEKQAGQLHDPDYTAGIKGALGKDGSLYLADGMAGQWEWPKARARIVASAQAERILVGIESVGGFRSAFQNLREVLPKDVKVMEIGVDRDKLTRALPWIALAENGKVFLVRGDWVTPFLAQAETFPTGTHDDMVDAVSGVYQMLAKGRCKVLVA
jgi:predicted phage terminase large subunit-like protein